MATSLTVFNDSQNVHATSIQKSTSDSVAWLIRNAKTKCTKDDENQSGHKLTKDDRERAAYMAIKNAWRPKRFYYIREWIMTQSANLALKQNVQERTVHSTHGISYGELLELIWLAIRDHPYKDDILAVLKQEVRDSSHLCFTGRFTRTLNSLGGFITEVRVDISENEQMSNRIVQSLKHIAVEHKQGTESYEHEGKLAVTAILEEFRIPERDRAVWLDAV
jgi:hypothetical protein